MYMKMTRLALDVTAVKAMGEMVLQSKSSNEASNLGLFTA